MVLFFPVIVVYPATPESPPGRLFFSSDSDKHPVFVERILHVPCRDEDILFVLRAVVRDQKAVAVPMAGQNSRNKVFARGKAIPSPPNAPYYSCSIQLVQKSLQASAVVAVKVEPAHGIPECEAVGFQGS